jgi:hypothetical protein
MIYAKDRQLKVTKGQIFRKLKFSGSEHRKKKDINFN